MLQVAVRKVCKEARRQQGGRLREIQRSAAAGCCQKGLQGSQSEAGREGGRQREIRRSKGMPLVATRNV